MCMLHFGMQVPKALVLRDWSLITGRGVATKWENHGSETFCAPPQDRVKLFAPSPFV